MSSLRATLCLPTSDRDRAHAFYGALGLETPDEPAEDGVPEPLRVVVNEELAVMLIPRGGFGWVTSGRPAVEPGTVECLLSLGVESTREVDAFLDRARAAGAVVAGEPVRKPWGYPGSFADPDGHLRDFIALSS